VEPSVLLVKNNERGQLVGISPDVFPRLAKSFENVHVAADRTAPGEMPDLENDFINVIVIDIRFGCPHVFLYVNSVDIGSCEYIILTRRRWQQLKRQSAKCGG
jgi:hypothetical protein